MWRSATVAAAFLWLALAGPASASSPRVYVEDSPAAQSLVDKARQLRRQERPVDAVKSLQRVIEDYPDKLMATGPDRYVSARRWVTDRIRGEPELLATYARVFEPVAAGELDRADGRSDWRRVMTRFPLTPSGLEAGLRLAASWLAIARPDEAKVVLDRLGSHPGLSAEGESDRAGDAELSGRSEGSPPSADGASARDPDSRTGREDPTNRPEDAAARAGAGLASATGQTAQAFSRRARFRALRAWSKILAGDPDAESAVDGLASSYGREVVRWSTRMRPPIRPRVWRSGTPGPGADPPRELPEPLWTLPLQGKTSEGREGGRRRRLRSTVLPQGWSPTLPTISGSTVYANDGRQLLAADVFSGQTRWRYAPALDEQQAGARGVLPPGLAARRSALDPRGVDLSEDQVVGVIGVTPSLPIHLRRFGMKTWLVCVDRHTGSPRWRLTAEDLDRSLQHGYFHSRPIVVGHRVLARIRRTQVSGFQDAFIVAISLEDGSLIWKRHLSSVSGERQRGPTLPPTGLRVHDGYAYAHEYGAATAKIAIDDGEVTWLTLLEPTRDAASSQTTPPVLSQHPTWPWWTPAGLVVPPPSPNEPARVLDPKSGRTVRRLEGEFWSEAAYALPVDEPDPALLLVGPTLRLIDARSFNVVWENKLASLEERVAGLGAVAGERAYIPTDTHVVAIDLGSGAVVWRAELQPAGNLLAFRHQLLVAGPEQMAGFLHWRDASRQLQAQIQDSPRDPGPAVALAQLAWRSGRFDHGPEVIDQALAAIDRRGRDAPSTARLQRAVFDAVLRLVRSEADAAPDELREAMFERLASATQTSKQQARYHVALAGFREAQGRFTRAVDHYQTVIENDALAGELIEFDGAARRAGIEASLRLRRLVRDQGREVYAAYDRRAAQELETLTRSSDPSSQAYLDLARRYPEAEAGAEALAGAAMLAEATGRLDRARTLLRRAASRASEPALVAELRNRLEELTRARRMPTLDRPWTWRTLDGVALPPPGPTAEPSGDPSTPPRVLIRNDDRIALVEPPRPRATQTAQATESGASSLPAGESRSPPQRGSDVERAPDGELAPNENEQARREQTQNPSASKEDRDSPPPSQVAEVSAEQAGPPQPPGSPRPLRQLWTRSLDGLSLEPADAVDQGDAGNARAGAGRPGMTGSGRIETLTMSARRLTLWRPDRGTIVRLDSATGRGVHRPVDAAELLEEVGQRSGRRAERPPEQREFLRMIDNRRIMVRNGRVRMLGPEIEAGRLAAAHGGRVVLGDARGRLVALAGDDPHPIWSLMSPLEHLRFVVLRDDALVLGGYKGVGTEAQTAALLVLDPASGTPRLPLIELDGELQWLGASDDGLIVSATSEQLVAHEIEYGGVVWRLDTQPEDFTGRGELRDGMLVLEDGSGMLVLLDARSGRRLQRAGLPFDQAGAAFWRWAGDGWIIAQQHELTRFDAAGTRRWTAALDGVELEILDVQVSKRHVLALVRHAPEFARRAGRPRLDHPDALRDRDASRDMPHAAQVLRLDRESGRILSRENLPLPIEDVQHERAHLVDGAWIIPTAETSHLLIGGR